MFGTQKVSLVTLQEVSAMIDNYFRGRGLDTRKQALPGSDGCGWWLTEGSARIYLFVQDSPAGPVLRITSPLVYIPEHNKESFYRRLLDLNSNLTSCALSTYDNYVLVISQRMSKGLVQSELDDMVWNVAYVADLLDDKLAQEFGTSLYKSS